MTRVLIVQSQMKQYRAPFFAKLGELLRLEGKELRVAYSDPSEVELQKKDNCELPPAYGVKVKGYQLWPRRFFYQPLLRAAMASDLVIVEQANRNVLNHFLLPLARMGLRRVAFWGHGEIRLPGRPTLSQWYRKKTLNWVSWWFAYTEGCAKYLQSQGVPASKITAVMNSVDTSQLAEQAKSLTAQERADARGRLGIPASARVGIFCGRLEKLKGLPFLIEASRMIRRKIPTFHLIVIGGGPEQEAVQREIEGLDWVHLAGPRFAREKAELMAISDAFLLPGALGLAVLDAFAVGLPLFTIRSELHGPEIEYLEAGINGLICEAAPQVFAGEVASVLNQTEELARLGAGARASAEKYSLENMAENFAKGIRCCLAVNETGRKTVGWQRAS